MKPAATLTDTQTDKRQVVDCVDEFTGFTAAGVSANKEASNVAKVILDDWCMKGPSYPSKGFFSDNGKEFTNPMMEDLTRRLDIEMKLTPSYSPFSNGKCERKYGAIDLTIWKIMEDDKNLSLNDALTHAAWARNCETGKHGLSPFQLVYGRTPHIPGVTEGNMMTDSNITNADTIRSHFQRQEKTKQEFRKADSNMRLKKRIFSYHDQKYDNGDSVIFEDKDGNVVGPATVKAMESKSIWVTHSGQLKKIASCKCRLHREEDSDNSDDDLDHEGEEDTTDTENEKEPASIVSENSERDETTDTIDAKENLETDTREAKEDRNTTKRLENKGSVNIEIRPTYQFQNTRR